MKVTVENLYSGKTDIFQGEPKQVKAQLFATYKWIGNYGTNDLHEILKRLSEAQAYSVQVE